MRVIVKIFLASLFISGVIKYGLPIVVDLQSLSLLEQNRLAIAILSLIPMVFLGVLWVKHP